MTHAAEHRHWVRLAVEQFEGPLCRYAARIVGDAERARDVVQETFLRLCRQPAGELNGHLAQWLFTVCRNQALDVLKDKKAADSLERGELSEPPAGDGSHPPEIVERAESAGRVVTLLATLPDRQREAVRLKFESGLSYREIAQAMDTTVGNVGVLIHEGIKTLRKKLGARDRGSGARE